MTQSEGLPLDMTEPRLLPETGAADNMMAVDKLMAVSSLAGDQELVHATSFERGRQPLLLQQAEEGLLPRPETLDIDEVLGRACRVAQLISGAYLPCSEADGAQADQDVRKFTTDYHRPQRGVEILEQLQQMAGVSEQKYHSYCIAAQKFLLADKGPSQRSEEHTLFEFTFEQQQTQQISLQECIEEFRLRLSLSEQDSESQLVLIDKNGCKLERDGCDTIMESNFPVQVLFLTDPLHASTMTSMSMPFCATQTLAVNRWGDATARFTVSLTLHILQIVAAIASMVTYYKCQQYGILAACLLMWCVTGIFLSWSAYKELQDFSCLPRVYRPFRDLVLIFWCGFLQMLPVKHLVDNFRSRTGIHDSSPSMGDNVPLHRRITSEHLQQRYRGTTLVGIVTGIPFAFFNMLAYYMLNESVRLECPYIMKVTVEHRRLVETVLLTASWLSICSIANGVVSLDLRVSLKEVNTIVDAPPLKTILHFLFRATEVASNIGIVILICTLTRPVLEVDTLLLARYMFPLPVLVLGLIFCGLLLWLRRNAFEGRKQPQRCGEICVEFWSAAVVGLVLIFVNPAHFVGKPGFIGTARKVNKSVAVIRVMEMAALIFVFFWMYDSPLPKECKYLNSTTTIHGLGLEKPPEPPHGPERPDKVFVAGPYFLQHHCNSLLLLLSTLLMHAAILLFVKDIRVGIANDIDDTMVALEVITADEKRLEVQLVDFYGFPSFLIRTAVLIDLQQRNVAGNALIFKIQTVLGRGAFGVVASVVVGTETVPYAMKLQQAGAVAVVEEQMVAELTGFVHPFLMRFHWWFDVPAERIFKDENGSELKDKEGNNTFGKAIIMDYIDSGPGGIYADLEAYLLHKAFPENVVSAPMDAREQVDWLIEARAFAAQLAEVGSFLHFRNIIHRDIKPANILLKEGPNWKRYVCLTDVGHSKVISAHSPAMSERKGTPFYAAPEISRKQGRKSPHACKVDVYSFGRLLAVMLHRRKRTSLVGGRESLIIGAVSQPLPASYMVNFPQCARDLILATTQVDPNNRPMFRNLTNRCEFFSTSFDHKGLAVPPLERPLHPFLQSGN